MASESSLLEVDPNEFDLEPAMDELLQAVGTSKARPKVVDVAPLARPRFSTE